MRASSTALPFLLPFLLGSQGCAQGRSPSDAAVVGRDTGDAIDAALVFPDAFVNDAPALDDAGASTDGSPGDAGSVPIDAAGPDAPSADAWRGDAWACPCTPGGACTTACGTTGSRACSSSCVESCAPPAEACNATDDDCDGACDEDLAACRAGIVRAYHDRDGVHLYTRDRAEALALGFRIEADPFFFVYPTAQPGTAPLHRCLLGRAHRLYTLDAGCEGSGAAYEGVLGWVAMGPVCGARALYRLSTRDNHFYTVDATERDFAVSIGYRDEGVAAYVW